MCKNKNICMYTQRRYISALCGDLKGIMQAAQHCSHVCMQEGERRGEVAMDVRTTAVKANGRPER